MVTVPAHNFCAPARAKLIAALRSMPGVEGTLGSSWSPGMTRTPSCFQRSWSCGSVIRLLPFVPSPAKITEPASQDSRNIWSLPDLSRDVSPSKKESSMGSTADKVKGAANEAMGKAKQGVGEATGSDRLQGEGAVQEVKGKGQQALGDAKEATKDAV